MNAIFWEIVQSFNMSILFAASLRLVMAVILGGIIGWEREHTNRPAGLRTHILVCTGAALVMVLSEFMQYTHGGDVDLTRMGAQVISGIGFLGAGTIIKEGFSVKGLTTAASLWVVSCIGLALGAGFYSGAIIATFLIYFTLIIMKKVLIRHANTKLICLKVDNVDEVYRKVSEELKVFKCAIYSTEVIISENGKTKELRFDVSVPENKESLDYLLLRIRTIEGVQAQHVE